MTDRELLEAAAKAACLRWKDVPGRPDSNPALWMINPLHTAWNPLADDGDALRLAVRLGMDLFRSETDIEAIAGLPPYASMERDVPAPFGIEQLGDDPYAAHPSRNLRAAAEIGRRMG